MRAPRNKATDNFNKVVNGIKLGAGKAVSNYRDHIHNQPASSSAPDTPISQPPSSNEQPSAPNGPGKYFVFTTTKVDTATGVAGPNELVDASQMADAYFLDKDFKVLGTDRTIRDKPFDTSPAVYKLFARPNRDSGTGVNTFTVDDIEIKGKDGTFIDDSIAKRLSERFSPHKATEPFTLPVDEKGFVDFMDCTVKDKIKEATKNSEQMRNAVRSAIDPDYQPQSGSQSIDHGLQQRLLDHSSKGLS